MDGLPEFKTHIAFVPCSKGVKSDHNSNHDLSGSSFKPNTTPVSVQDTGWDSYESDQPDTLKFSQFISEITGESPSGSTNWKTILSAVEIKRNWLGFVGGV